MRGIFHLHTNHSYDSMTRPGTIVELALGNGIDFALISDHDTLQGSIEAKEIALKRGGKLHIPVAGEFLTDIGDVIVAEVPPDFAPSFDHKDLCKRAKESGGYTILPHPFDGHHLDRIDFTLIDCIEIFNSRSKPEHDSLSQQLALNLNKPVIYGADAHFSSDVLNCPFEWEGDLLAPEMLKPVRLSKTPPHRKWLSQTVKGFKQKDPALVIRSLIRLMKRKVSKP